MDEEPYCPSPSQTQSTSSKAKGICSVCFKTRKLHDKDGNVHLHGPRRKPCKGSKEPPAHTIDAFNATHTKHGQILNARSGVSHRTPGHTLQRQHTGGSDSRRQFSGPTALTPAATTRPTQYSGISRREPEHGQPG